MTRRSGTGLVPPGRLFRGGAAAYGSAKDGAAREELPPTMLTLKRIDHFVLTVADVEATCEFYERALGMRPVTFAGGRRALTFGEQKINLHQAGAELEPRAARPAPGSSDFCLIADGPMEEIVRHLDAAGVELELAPSTRTGALGPITSVYFRDPDRNLVEVSVYGDAA